MVPIGTRGPHSTCREVVCNQPNPPMRQHYSCTHLQLHLQPCRQQEASPDPNHGLENGMLAAPKMDNNPPMVLTDLHKWYSPTYCSCTCRPAETILLLFTLHTLNSPGNIQCTHYRYPTTNWYPTPNGTTIGTRSCLAQQLHLWTPLAGKLQPKKESFLSGTDQTLLSDIGNHPKSATLWYSLTNGTTIGTRSCTAQQLQWN